MAVRPRNGVVVGNVAPQDRLVIRAVSPRCLRPDERLTIVDLRQLGLSLQAITVGLGRAPSTISRELRHHVLAGRGYRPFDAHPASHGSVSASPPAAGWLRRSPRGPWSPSPLFGVSSRRGSVIISATGLSATRRDGRALRAAIKLYVSRICVCYGLRGWRRIAARHCAPVTIPPNPPTSAAPAAELPRPMITIHDRPSPVEDPSRAGH
ncbi:helix-turn-helix domain-containing protein [Mycolicibacter kumamotonensis]|uniref:helix-turn-helix domain-containing protein n=1 Tax=Mycolicibacter kumamotonensis TaxID=354243 RepID=UPI0034DF6C3B